MQLHPRSLVLGLAIGACALFAMAQAAPQYASTVRVQYMPHPRDMVQIEEGTPFTVPVGKVFVATAVGVPDIATFEIVRLSFDGKTMAAMDWASMTGGGVGGQPTMVALPQGLTAKAGMVVTVQSGFTQGRAWGYLADQ